MKALKDRPAFPAALIFIMAALISACSSSKEPSPNVKPSTPEAFAQWYQECWDAFNLSKWDDFKKWQGPGDGPRGDCESIPRFLQDIS
jgi:hypothetical protein